MPEPLKCLNFRAGRFAECVPGAHCLWATGFECSVVTMIEWIALGPVAAAFALATVLRCYCSWLTSLCVEPMLRGYSHLTVVPCLVNGFTPRVGRRW
jgi:hypothetical protein